MSAMWLDSNSLEMRTAEYCMYLTKFCELLVCYCAWYSSGEFNHNKATTSQIYRSWSLRYISSTRSRTGVLITQNEGTGRVSKWIINTVRSICTGRPATPFKSLGLSLLCSKNCGLSSFRPMEDKNTLKKNYQDSASLSVSKLFI